MAESKTPSMGSIERMEIRPGTTKGKFAGATVMHHMKSMPSHSSKMGMGMEYREPESHIFGASEGHEMLAHIANHMNIEEGSLGKSEKDDVGNNDGVGKDGEYD